MYIVFIDDELPERQFVEACWQAYQTLSQGQNQPPRLTGLETYPDANDLIALIQQVKSGGRPLPALILLDMQIGDDDEAGIHMLQQTRTELPQVPVAIVSRSDLKRDVLSSYESGACSYIHKSTRQGVYETRLRDAFEYWGQTVRIPAEYP